MTANASTSKEGEKSILHSVSGKIAESVLSIMQMTGISAIEVRKIKTGEYEKIVSNIDLFEDIPEEIRASGFILKDSIAKILAAAGIVLLKIETSNDDVELLHKNYKSMVDAACKVDIKESESESSS